MPRCLYICIENLYVCNQYIDHQIPAIAYSSFKLEIEQYAMECTRIHTYLFAKCQKVHRRGMLLQEFVILRGNFFYSLSHLCFFFSFNFAVPFSVKCVYGLDVSFPLLISFWTCRLLCYIYMDQWVSIEENSQSMWKRRRTRQNKTKVQQQQNQISGQTNAGDVDWYATAKCCFISLFFFSVHFVHEYSACMRYICSFLWIFCSWKV